MITQNDEVSTKTRARHRPWVGGAIVRNEPGACVPSYLTHASSGLPAAECIAGPHFVWRRCCVRFI